MPGHLRFLLPLANSLKKKKAYKNLEKQVVCLFVFCLFFVFCSFCVFFFYIIVICL